MMALIVVPWSKNFFITTFKLYWGNVCIFFFFLNKAHITSVLVISTMNPIKQLLILDKHEELVKGKKNHVDLLHNRVDTISYLLWPASGSDSVVENPYTCLIRYNRKKLQS